MGIVSQQHTLPASAYFCHLLVPLVHAGEKFVKEILLLIVCGGRWFKLLMAKHQYMILQVYYFLSNHLLPQVCERRDRDLVHGFLPNA